MPADKGKQKCAHQGCTCQVIPGQGVETNAKVYCCQECADGKGCHHSLCTCAK